MPTGVLTHAAHLLAPPAPISVDQLMPDALPDAWKDDATTAYALSISLSTKAGRTLP
ncbi:MAG: hypothetical protein FD149_2446 [Rhodospirillaceae bacterium]|nr:MAG: hypothetical protein FD149_2446 [Rhodospirillaceae bacterium]